MRPRKRSPDAGPAAGTPPLRPLPPSKRLPNDTRHHRGRDGGLPLVAIGEDEELAEDANPAPLTTFADPVEALQEQLAHAKLRHEERMRAAASKGLKAPESGGNGRGDGGGGDNDGSGDEDEESADDGLGEGAEGALAFLSHFNDSSSEEEVEEEEQG